MKQKIFLLTLFMSGLFATDYAPIETKPLTIFEKAVLQQKHTERAFTGMYYDFYKEGVYYCKQCGHALFTSKDKFKSHCGWPSFDDAIKGAVKQIPDRDGWRVEIVCAHCGGHLGHIFKGEGYTAKNQRFCVNSASIQHKATK